MQLSNTEASDAELLAASRDPEAAFATFYRRHVRDVLNYVRSRGLDPHTAADIVSATFLAALKSRKSYSSKHETAGPWLITIASHQIVDATRSELRQTKVARRIALLDHRELTTADLAGYAHPTDAGESSESARVAQALEALSSDQRLAVIHRVLGHAEYADLASEFGVSQGTIRQRVSRALRELRSRLNIDDQEASDA